MAAKLPKFIALKSSVGNFAFYDREKGRVRCAEVNVFNPFTKIAVEAAQDDESCIHLRFCHTNKYWRCAGPDDKFVSAESDQPYESLEWSSTLFKPYTASDEQQRITVRLEHVKTQDDLRVHQDTRRIHVGYSGGINSVFFSVIDWDSLLTMPPHVAIRGDNGKYLTAWMVNDRRFLRFSSVDGSEGYALHSVEMDPDGYARIKSEHFGRFWMCKGEDWVLAESADGKDKDALFWPVQVGDSTIALRSKHRFCYRESKYDYLRAGGPIITGDSKLVVEQLVLERSIDNVRYRMKDARIFNQKPFVAGTGTAANNSDTDATLAVKVSFEDTRTRSFTKSVSLKVGVKTSIKAGFAFIADGKIEVSAEVGGTLQWGETTLEKKVVEAQYTVRVPAKTKVKVNYVGMEGTCSVPFSYIQREKTSTDGRIVFTQHIDGIFTGVNYHSFDFEQLPPEPL